MNSYVQDVIAFIDALHESKHLIAQAYADGSVELDDFSQKKLRRLQQLQAMRPDPMRENSLRLSGNMVKVLDQAVERVRNLKVSVNFSEQIARLSTLADEYQHAFIEDRPDDQDDYANEFDSAAFEISDEVEGMLVHVRSMVDNNFANVTTYGEKLRQNAHYMAQLKKLAETLVALESEHLKDQLDSSLDFELLRVLYFRHILRNMSNWRSILLDIATLMENYLSRLRRIEPMARSIRMMHMWFRKHPEYAPKDVEEYPEIPLWSLKCEGLALSPAVDIRDRSSEESLVDLARTIEQPALVVRTKREKGVLVVDDEPDVVYIEPSAAEVLMGAFCAIAVEQDREVFITDYLRQDARFAQEDPEVIIMSILEAVESFAKSPYADQLMISRVERALAQPYSGNVIVEDIRLCPKR